MGSVGSRRSSSSRRTAAILAARRTSETGSRCAARSSDSTARGTGAAGSAPNPSPDHIPEPRPKPKPTPSPAPAPNQVLLAVPYHARARLWRVLARALRTEAALEQHAVRSRAAGARAALAITLTLNLALSPTHSRSPELTGGRAARQHLDGRLLCAPKTASANLTPAPLMALYRFSLAKFSPLWGKIN